MDREAWDNYLEKGILGLVLGILAIGPLCFGAVHPVPFAGIQAITGGVLLLWAARLWVMPKPRLLFHPLCWGVLAFVIYALVRYATADIEYVARQEVSRVLTYAALFFAVLNNLHRQEHARFIVYGMVGLAMCLAGVAVYQFTTNSQQVWHLVSPYAHRGKGTYINPNHFGGFLELILPLAIAHALLARQKILPRVLFAYASLVILAGIAVTISRGAWVSTLLALGGLCVVLMGYRPYRLPLILLLVVTVGAGAVFVRNSFSTQIRLRQVVSGEGKGKMDDSLRFTLWEPAVKVWQDNVWFGAGPGHFDSRFREYRPAAVQRQPERVHNDYLNTLADWGVVGFGLVAICWGLLAWGVARTWRFVRGSFSELGERKGSNKFAIVLGTSLGLGAVLVHSVVDFNMHIPANAILVVVWMALLASHIRFATEKFWYSLRVWGRSVVTVAIVGTLVILVYQSWQRTREAHWLARAAHAEAYSPEQVSALKRAHEVDSQNGQTTYAIGEALRIRSLDAANDYRQIAEEAMAWLKTGMSLNPWDGYNYLRYAMCLAWLERGEESWAFLNRAEALDPNGSYMLAQIGICYVEAGRYAAARPWFQRSLKLQRVDNVIAREYLRIVESRLQQSAGLPVRLRETGAKAGGKL